MVDVVCSAHRLHCLLSLHSRHGCSTPQLPDLGMDDTLLAVRSQGPPSTQLYPAPTLHFCSTPSCPSQSWISCWRWRPMNWTWCCSTPPPRAPR